MAIEVAQVLPDVLDRVQLRGARGQEDERHVVWDDEAAGGVPACAVEQQDSVRSSGHGAGDLVEVELHGLGIGVGHGEGGARAARRADGAEEIRALVTLVGGLARP